MTASAQPVDAREVANAPFSIVVLTWKSAHEIPGLVESIDAHLETEHELIFVDNGSDDGSAEVARRLAPQSRVIALEENLGFGAGNNVGIRAASHDIVVLLNADTIMLDDSLADLADLARRTGAICGPRMLNEDRTLQISAHPRLGSWPLLVSAVWPGALMPDFLATHCEPWRSDRRADVGWMAAACVAAPTKLLLDLGGFDESFDFYGEDIDLAVRADLCGAGNIFAPDVARIVHIGQRSVSQRFDDRNLAIQVETRAWLARKNYGRRRAFQDRLALGFMHGTRWLAKALLRRPDAARDRGYFLAALRGRVDVHGRTSEG